MKRIFVNVAVAFGILTFASCLKDNDGTTNPTQGALMVANLTPDATGVNVTLNSKGYVSNLGYGVYTPYYLQNAGTYDVGVASGSTTISDSIKLEPNKYYSYFIIDTLASLKYAFVEDKLVAPSSDSVYVRFLNFSPNSGVVNFRDSATHNYFSKSRTFNDQKTTASYADFTKMRAAILTFQIVGSDSAVLASKKDTLAGGHIYTIMAKGKANGTGAQALGIGKIQNY
ncbi:DUF4397 domain-containing protein [Parafilimonas sp.]|uniref:DUF4397 domain-containing protein n=1 Tax=Parafilimonas sp. TaxID=1969739 RepID=UPI003F7E9627